MDFTGVTPVSDQIKKVLDERDKKNGPIERRRHRAVLIVSIIAMLAAIAAVSIGILQLNK